MIDGLPLGELANHPDVVSLLGGTMPPDGGGKPPVQVLFLSAIRSLKTMSAAAAAIRASQTVDVSGLTHGEVPRLSVVSVSIDLSKVAFNQISGVILANPDLKSLLVKEPTDGVVELKHPSGRTVEIACVAGARAGSSLVARWSAGVIFDEAARMVGGDDQVVNLKDMRGAVLGRLLPGAQLLYISSPWAAEGPVYEWFCKYRGVQNPDILVLKGTGPQLNPVWWTPEHCEDLRKRDPDAHRTDVLGEFLNPLEKFLDPVQLASVARSAPAELPHDDRCRYAAAMDPATRGNAWTLAVGRRDADKWRVVLTRQWKGSSASPLNPDLVFNEIHKALHPYGIQLVYSDQWSGDAMAALARRHGLTLVTQQWTAQQTFKAYQALRDAVQRGEIELGPDERVIRDLSSVERRVNLGGPAIRLPESGDGRHADFASAIVLAYSVPLPPPTAISAKPKYGTDEYWRKVDQDEDDWTMRRQRALEQAARYAR